MNRIYNLTDKELLKIHDDLQEIWRNLESIKTLFAERDDGRSLKIFSLQNEIISLDDSLFKDDIIEKIL